MHFYVLYALYLAYSKVATASITLQWSERTYGFDGPWNAVTVNVGGFQNGTTESDQWTPVDLFPGMRYSTWVPSDTVCAGAETGCGAGGTWAPADGGLDVSYQPTADAATDGGLYMDTTIRPQNLNIVSIGSGNAHTVPNASLASITQWSFSPPTKNTTSRTDLAAGFLSIGGDTPEQIFGSGSSVASDIGVLTWLPPGYLYNQSIISSNSFGLHYGSAALNYSGSLVFGGYDKSRAIAPITSYPAYLARLQDIVFGVETGGSPLPFDSMSGLLLDNSSQTTAMDVEIEPLSSYFLLPRQTCDKLATILPIRYDDTTGYYLWDTADPLYENTTTSAAYIGFVFPPNAGDSANVTIKVPLVLLNLMLKPTGSGSSNAVPYFPCMPFVPPGGSNYKLGRAFLQSAFWARNHELRVTWLAQAPGPGAALSAVPTDIMRTDTSLDLFSGPDLFRQSWDGHWTPLPGGDTNGTNHDDHSGLSTGAKAGIGVGAAVGAILLLLVAFLLWKRLSTKKGAKSTTTSDYYTPEVSEISTGQSDPQEPAARKAFP